MGNKSSFGRIADIKIPFSFEPAKTVSVYDCLFKVDIAEKEATVTVKCKVMQLSQEYVGSKNCTVYKYELNDGQNVILLSSFQKLEAVPNKSYIFQNVSLYCLNNERQLRFFCTSQLVPCEDVVTKTTENHAKQIIKVKTVKKQKFKCMNCSEEIPKDNIDGEIYTCDDCDISALVPDITYDLMVQFKDSEKVKSLVLSQQLFEKVGSMKLLLSKEFAIVCEDSTIISMDNTGDC